MKAWIARHPWYGSLAGFLFLAFAFAVGTGLTPFYIPPYKPDVMHSFSTEHQTFSIGRYLVDLPRSFNQISGGWGEIELYYGLDKNFTRVYASVDDLEFTQAEFLAKVKARRDELSATLNDETKKPMLLKTEQIDPNTFLFRRMDSAEHDNGIQSEVHQLIGHKYVKYQLASYDEKSEVGHMSAKHIDAEPSEAKLRLIASKLKPESAGGPGFYFQGVIFDVGQDDEVASFNFDAPDAPDLQLRFDYHAVTGQPEESLFDRVKWANDNVPGYDRVFATFRKRGTSLSGMHAEELLRRSSNPFMTHDFRLETRTDKQSLAQPMISIELLTGTRYRKGNDMHPEGPSSISDDQAIQLWDEIVKSVRLRPNSLPPGTTALGEQVPTCRFYESCPRSGYWMKQVDHPDYEFNGFHAEARVHQPFEQGQTFLPEIEDDARFQPFTTWTWRRDLG